MAYKWANPYEWLMGHVENMDAEELRGHLMYMARELDHEALQGLYESAMSEDGYFQELKENV